jgi:DNA-binding Lrp family transcriptional regulator
MDDSRSVEVTDGRRHYPREWGPYLQVPKALVLAVGPTKAVLVSEIRSLTLLKKVGRGTCYASVRNLGERIGLSERQTRTLLRELCSDGIIIDLTPQEKRRPHHYIVNDATLRALYATLCRQKEDTLESASEAFVQAETGALEAADGQAIPAPHDNGDGPTTPAGQEYFRQFRRKRWATPEQKRMFEECEAEVGSKRMLDAVLWAAANNIKGVPAICTTARKHRGPDGKPRREPRWRLRPDGTPEVIND